MIRNRSWTQKKNGCSFCQWIGLREFLQESPIHLMGKSMVSCKFSLKPIHWFWYLLVYLPYVSPPHPHLCSSWAGPVDFAALGVASRRSAPPGRAGGRKTWGCLIWSQWPLSLDWFVGENLQETMVFAIKLIGLKPANFPIIQFYDIVREYP